ncbi:MAG TPA: CHASE3 domain-containing protein [Terrimicrobiaceae bacterium]
MNPHPAQVKQALRKVRLFFVMMAALLTGGIAASYFAGRAALNATEKVRQFDAVIEGMQDLRSTVQDAETGQRGYLLTREAGYLGPYEEAIATLQRKLETVQKMAEAEFLPAERVRQLESLIGRKLDELRKTVSLVQSGRVSAALEIVRGDEGKGLMDSIRDEIGGIVSAQENARATANEVADSAIQVRGGVFLAAVIINLVVLLWAYRRIQKEIMQQFVANLETRRQKEILAVTLSSIGDAVIITDVRGRITFLNGIAEDLTGWSAREAEDRPCAEVFRIVNEETRHPVESPVDKVLASGAIAGLANHTVLIRKDGSELPIDDSGAPIRESDGTVRGVVLIFRDFTAHKDFELTLIRAKEEIEESSKAKDKFLATLSHELRTPLTPVLATLSSWEATSELPMNLRSDLQRLRRNVELEARLIDDLLDLTRIENGKLSLEKEFVDVHSLIHSAAALFRGEVQARDLQLHCLLEADSAYFEADPARLQQIFLNIIGNAVKFTPDGGIIEIATANPRDTELSITVTDNGIGMSEDVMARLFRRFEQGDLAPDRKYRGLGLGLSIAKALAEAHGGTLRAESKGPDRGSTFVLSFPLSDARSRDLAAASPVSSPRDDRKNLRVLLIEDHEDTAQVMRNVLRQMGHEVETCATVATACQKLEEQEFDIILSDIGLPDGTGIEFIKVARKICQTPAVALTGYGMAEDVDRCLQAGFDEHLTKPIDIERLQITLSKISGKRTGALEAETPQPVGG